MENNATTLRQVIKLRAFGEVGFWFRMKDSGRKESKIIGKGDEMKISCLAVMLVWAMSAAALDFDQYFLNKTMRLDYFHAGNAGEEHFAVDRVVSDGPWAGNPKNLIDALRWGKYLFEVFDSDSGVRLYSEGFATIYGEWETTGEAKRQWRVFHESLRFPWPRKPVRVALHKRDAENRFQPVWETLVDPASRAVNPADLPSPFPVWELLNHGDPQTKVDLLILGDGYSAKEMDKFRADAARMSDALFSHEPFRSRKSDFNVRLIGTPAGESGVSRPHPGVFKRTPLSAHFSSFDSERYVLSYDNRRLRDIASAAPYEYMVILVNERTYGGGGIYRWQATASVDNAFSDYLFVHEFGHHFAGLADEYYTSSVAYELSETVQLEPWEANVTALLDKENLKWKDLVAEDTPLPTPWQKEAFEKASIETQKKRAALRQAKASEEDLEALFTQQRAFETELLGNMKYSGKVGAFEGASYMAKGLYRSSADCLMFTRDQVGFCPVCSRAIEAVIDVYSR